MSRSIALIFIACVIFSAPAFATLGDNENEIENLFGKPLKEGAADKKGITTNVYGKGSYVILVQFLNHLSLAESYTRTDKNELSQKEIDAFLEGSSNGRPWEKDPSKRAWERADHKAKAWCVTVGEQPTLFIQAD